MTDLTPEKRAEWREDAEEQTWPYPEGAPEWLPEARIITLLDALAEVERQRGRERESFLNYRASDREHRLEVEARFDKAEQERIRWEQDHRDAAKAGERWKRKARAAQARVAELEAALAAAYDLVNAADAGKIDAQMDAIRLAEQRDELSAQLTAAKDRARENQREHDDHCESWYEEGAHAWTPCGCWASRTEAEGLVARADQWREKCLKAEQERDEQASDAYTAALRDAESKIERASALAARWYDVARNGTRRQWRKINFYEELQSALDLSKPYDCERNL